MDQSIVALALAEIASGPPDTLGIWGMPAAASEDVQGLVVSPFDHLPEATAIFLRLGPSGAWLRRLLDAGHITAATGRTEPCCAVAVTASGLQRMKLPEEVLKTFALPFLEGMTEPDRARRLGDDAPDALWQQTLAWSGFDPDSQPKPPRGRTGDTVHALLLLYAFDADKLRDLTRTVLDLIEPEGASVVFTLPLTLKPGGGMPGTPPREHFGFADGFSQPMPQEVEKLRHPLHGVPLGEVLMGYNNAHGEPATGPYVARLTAGDRELADIAGETRQGSLGANGTYVTVRQLYQDVAEFRASMAKTAQALNDPSITADWIAQRVIGREYDGDLLVPGGTLPAVSPGQPDNDFGFFAKDRLGFGCPVGSHIRRSNPRDGLAPNEGARESTRNAANNHRILRRARKYGDPLPPDAPDDRAKRGLLFIALHTDIARQFEFIQQTWLLNPVFANLPGETDPLLGPAGPFTLPGDPVRHVAHVETFVRLVGGEYFFMPSFRAMRYLAKLA